MTDTDFASVLQRAHDSANGAPFYVPDDWMQGRTVYGGLAAAMVLKAMRGHADPSRNVRSLLLSFIGPLHSAPFVVRTQLIRSGKSVTVVDAKLIQNERICCTAVGSFGADRDAQAAIPPIERIDMPTPHEAFELPYIEGLTPAFTRHFHYRWAVGDMPFSGGGGREIGGWINFREETECLTEEWLIALADAWPTPVLSTLQQPAAASTVTWALGFVHSGRTTCAANDWWAYHCVVDCAERGYAHERSTVWDPDGRVAVYSQQTTAVFA